MPIINVLPVSNRNIQTFTSEITIPADLLGPVKISFPMPLADKTDPTNTLTMTLEIFDLDLNDFRHSVSFTWRGGDYTSRDGTVSNPDPAMIVSGADYAGRRVRMVLSDFTKGMRVGVTVEY